MTRLAGGSRCLGDSLVSITTLAVDSVNYGGAITVVRDPALLDHDPFARIFPGTIVETDLLRAPQHRPALSSSATAASTWPGGRVRPAAV